MKIYCFDLDGTLCTNTEGSYESAEPYFDRIAKVNELFEAGEKILIFTARGTVTGINWRELTESQLKLWGVKYHELQLGKPFAHVYVDDRGISDESFFANL
jgi:phosphoglycolate phosphatase-like HAD superfamily hydrolase